MNVNHLRRQLRTGGYDKLARNLPAYLLEHGVPCVRQGQGLTVRFEQGQAGLLARVQTRTGWILVADEHQVHRTREDLPKVAETGRTRTPFSFAAPAELIDRADRYRAGTGLSRSALVARALDNYLSQRGA